MSVHKLASSRDQFATVERGMRVRLKGWHGAEVTDRVTATNRAFEWITLATLGTVYATDWETCEILPDPPKPGYYLEDLGINGTRLWRLSTYGWARAAGWVGADDDVPRDLLFLGDFAKPGGDPS